jgi:PAS domain S-box-containing protein
LQQIRDRKTFAASWSALEKRLLPSYVWTSDPLTFWRERILFIICFIAAVLGPIALVPSLLLAYREGLWSVILIDSLAYMAVVTILIARNSPFMVRALTIYLILYALGVCLLFILGPVGAGYIWLFGASVLISAFIGLSAAIWTLALNMIALLSVGIFIAYGNPGWEIHVDNALEIWLVMAVNFLLLNALIVITMAFMLNGLKTALLTEQKISESLRESEERWKFALEGAGDGLWDWDVVINSLFFSKQWKAMLGYADHEIGNTLDEWERRVHPEDKAEAYAALERHLRRETETYQNEHRLLCKDGSYMGSGSRQSH